MSSKFRKWDIWWAIVKFEDSNDCKERPVLIYNDAVYVISFKMTSTDRGDGQNEYKIKEWHRAGLEKPTSVRIGKVLKLEEKDLLRKIGRLSPADIMQLELKLATR